MKFEKRNFMGIELDVLVGHPEHELLFVATQVARAAGLKDPANAVANYRKGYSLGLTLSGLIGDSPISLPLDDLGRKLRSNTALMKESEVYAMLLRGKAPQSEPFRKWVAEEVLPSIRKTGSYHAEESSNPIAVGIMDELKTLRGEVIELKSMIQALTAHPFSLQAPPSAARTSPRRREAAGIGHRISTGIL